MRTFVVSALALGAMTSAALAGEPATKAAPAPAKAAPVVLTAAQMDQVAAGQVGICGVCTNLGVAAALNVLSVGSFAGASTGEQTINVGTDND